MPRPGSRWITWTPRILCILFAAFISIFAFDVFDEGHGFWKTAADLGMHLIPTAVVVLVTVLAWRREWIGTLAFFTTGILYCLSKFRHPSGMLLIAGPQFLIGILFLLSWRQRRGGRRAG